MCCHLEVSDIIYTHFNESNKLIRRNELKIQKCRVDNLLDILIYHSEGKKH